VEEINTDYLIPFSEIFNTILRLINFTTSYNKHKMNISLICRSKPKDLQRRSKIQAPKHQMLLNEGMNWFQATLTSLFLWRNKPNISKWNKDLKRRAFKLLDTSQSFIAPKNLLKTVNKSSSLCLFCLLLWITWDGCSGKKVFFSINGPGRSLKLDSYWYDISSQAYHLDDEVLKGYLWNYKRIIYSIF